MYGNGKSEAVATLDGEGIVRNPVLSDERMRIYYVYTIDDSELKLYNAFSPNGDGINDTYKIYARSIVSMKIAIFNRWGQTVRTIAGKMNDLLPSDAEPDNDGGYLFEIWDGRFNGDVVNDGVYFINVQAVGAGGEQYDKRADINVLKGLGTGN